MRPPVDLGFGAIQFVAIGHVTNDHLKQGFFPGGSALYAGLTAAKLGAKVRIVTSFGADFIGRELLSQAGIELDATASEKTTTFQALDAGNRRGWRVLSRARPLSRRIEGADLVFACPVLAEVEAESLKPQARGILAAGLQGWLRSMGEGGIVEPRSPADLSFLGGCKVLFCSDEDLAENARCVLPDLLQMAEIVVVSEGARGAIVYLKRQPHRVHACLARLVDPTGAGDAFASSFLLALASGRDALEAAAIAACAASLVIEAPGPEGIANLSGLANRLAWYRANVARPSPIKDSLGGGE